MASILNLRSSGFRIFGGSLTATILKLSVFGFSSVPAISSKFHAVDVRFQFVSSFNEPRPRTRQLSCRLCSRSFSELFKDISGFWTYWLNILVIWESNGVTGDKFRRGAWDGVKKILIAPQLYLWILGTYFSTFEKFQWVILSLSLRVPLSYARLIFFWIPGRLLFLFVQLSSEQIFKGGASKLKFNIEYAIREPAILL